VITDSTLPRATQELVKIRASQINGCGFCTDMARTFRGSIPTHPGTYEVNHE
jgi:alkylhydroperoxidase family enzyme